MCQWGILLDPSLWYNTYLVVKFLWGWFVGETLQTPPSTVQSFDQSEAVEGSHQMSSIQNSLFFILQLQPQAISNYQNWGGGGVNSNWAVYKSFTQPLCILRPLTRYREQALWIMVILYVFKVYHESTETKMCCLLYAQCYLSLHSHKMCPHHALLIPLLFPLLCSHKYLCCLTHFYQICISMWILFLILLNILKNAKIAPCYKLISCGHFFTFMHLSKSFCLFQCSISHVQKSLHTCHNPFLDPQ